MPILCQETFAPIVLLFGFPSDESHSRQISEVSSPGKLYSSLMEVIVRFARSGLIHGDFNEFNILIRRSTGEPVVIDFPQMVSTSHTNAEWCVSERGSGYRGLQILNDVRDKGTSIVTLSAFAPSSEGGSVTKAICIQGSVAQSTGKWVRKMLKKVMVKISALMSSSLRVDLNTTSRRCWKRQVVIPPRTPAWRCLSFVNPIFAVYRGWEGRRRSRVLTFG